MDDTKRFGACDPNVADNHRTVYTDGSIKHSNVAAYDGDVHTDDSTDAVRSGPVANTASDAASNAAAAIVR